MPERYIIEEEVGDRQFIATVKERIEGKGNTHYVRRAVCMGKSSGEAKAFALCIAKGADMAVELKASKDKIIDLEAEFIRVQQEPPQISKDFEAIQELNKKLQAELDKLKAAAKAPVKAPVK